MFEDQMVELLPARTTMSMKKCKKGKKHGGGNTTNTALAFAAIVQSAHVNGGPGDDTITVVQVNTGDATADADAG